MGCPCQSAAGGGGGSSMEPMPGAPGDSSRAADASHATAGPRGVHARIADPSARGQCGAAVPGSTDRGPKTEPCQTTSSGWSAAEGIRRQHAVEQYGQHRPRLEHGAMRVVRIFWAGRQSVKVVCGRGWRDAVPDPVINISPR